MDSGSSLPLIFSPALADRDAELRAPAPGRLRFDRQNGEILVPGAHVGILVLDERSFDLIVPPHAAGAFPARLVTSARDGRWSRVGFGQSVCRLTSLDLLTEATSSGATAAEAADLFEVRAPSHGTFYARPAPGAPRFVEPGQRIQRGVTLGLVEVMKCFSPILFEPGPGIEAGTVRDLVAIETGEVSAQTVLFRIELER